MPRDVNILVLFEDLQARVFLYRALEEIDPGLPRRARFIPYPGSVFREGERGVRVVGGYKVYSCGSQHVRENYHVVVKQRRSGAALRPVSGCRLIIHVDVDNTNASGRSVKDRRDELAKSCEEHGVEPPDAAEPVAHVIPRRNIETWIHFLMNGLAVNEFDEYPKLDAHEADAEPAAVAFASHARAGTAPTNAPPSLLDGLKEFKRVL